jgi:nitrate reductase gamma subunit
MRVLSALIAVLVLGVIAWIGAGAGMQWIFGVAVPYAAFAIFVIFFINRIRKWASSPVPYRIPTTCGQQKSLDWIKHDCLESPHGTMGVIGRMFLEVFLFRSLFRNTRTDLVDDGDGKKLVYAPVQWLWLAGITFHIAFLTIILRHLRFFTEPVPFFVQAIEMGDGAFQLTLPALYQTDIVIVAALGFLFLRRILSPQLRYISLANDYFPLFLILAIAGTGILMRHVWRVDIVSIKQVAMGLVSFSPASGEVLRAINPLFYAHFFLVSVLVAYFPFSKLMHLGGVFLSPTRNLANNSREERHVNPWNYDVKVHTYEAYEDDFREVMKKAELPLDKE